MSKTSFLARCRHVLQYYVPAIAAPLVAYILRLSKTSSVWNFRTAVLVAIIRAIFNDPTPRSMLEEQQGSLVYGPAPDTMWVVADALSVPTDNNLLDVVSKAIVELANGPVDVPETTLDTVKGEWIGSRRGTANAHNKPATADHEKFQRLIADTSSDLVFIFLHGGQFYLRNPASRRTVVHELVKRTGGRCFSIAYRLSPQHMFPAALLDLLIVYMNLLHPLSGSNHPASVSKSICICGDSSGGNIALAFLQLVLCLQRQSPSDTAHVVWNGRKVVLPCPRVVVSHSGYLDLTRSLPSETENLKYDMIPAASTSPFPRASYLQDCIWPAPSPRNHVYAPNELLTHPLVSPVAASNWENHSTAVLLSVGQECLADGSIVLAKRMAKQAVTVKLELYNGMPHDFTIAMTSSRYSQECLNSWAMFAKLATTTHPLTSFDLTLGKQAVIWDVSGHNHVEDIAAVSGPERSLDDLVQGMKDTIASWDNPPARS